MTKTKDSYSVYVIQLDAEAKRDRTTSSMPVYVGMTGLTIEKRFHNHMTGHKASRVVNKYGRRLRPELFSHLNPMSRGTAAETERCLAAELKRKGFEVFGGH
jgi:hypothetical protein